MRVIWKVAVGLAFVLTARPPDRLVRAGLPRPGPAHPGDGPAHRRPHDIPDAIRERGGLDSVDFGVLQPKLMTDIPKLTAGAVGAQYWAAYVPVTTLHGGEHPAVYALEQIDLVRRLCGKYSRSFSLALTAADVERNFKAARGNATSLNYERPRTTATRDSRISCLIGIEGGHAIETRSAPCGMFYELGVRYMTLTHWETIDWADAATDSAKHGGLTPFGEEVSAR